MGITRHSLHKRRSTGGKKVALHKKRKYDMGRQAANTKLSNDQRTHMVRGRGGHIKFRALRMHTGNFSWPGEGACKPPPCPPLSLCVLGSSCVEQSGYQRTAVPSLAAPGLRWLSAAAAGVGCGSSPSPSRGAGCWAGSWADGGLG